MNEKWKGKSVKITFSDDGLFGIYNEGFSLLELTGIALHFQIYVTRMQDVWEKTQREVERQKAEKKKPLQKKPK